MSPLWHVTPVLGVLASWDLLWVVFQHSRVPSLFQLLQGCSCLAVAGLGNSHLQGELISTECLSNSNSGFLAVPSRVSLMIEPSQSIACLCRFSVGSFSRFSIALLRKKIIFPCFLKRFCSQCVLSQTGQPFPGLRAEAHPCSVASPLMHSWPLPEVLAR